MSIPMIMGLESELACAGSAAATCERVCDVVPTYRVRGWASFWQNGGSHYVDCGDHPEVCTPECFTPTDVVRYKEAMHRAMGRAARLVRPQARVARCQIDYGSGETWGQHENYGHQCRNCDALHRDLLPFLASRVIYAGAGGLDPSSDGIVFSLSPRATRMSYDISESSTGGRALIHIKDQPMADHAWHRLHLICGENLCSHRGEYLKIGATALVVALHSMGVLRTETVQLPATNGALRALQTFAADPTCTATVQTVRGRAITARELQYHYLACAAAHVEALPEWAPAVVQVWHETLDALEHPESLATVLDWPMKKALFDAHIAKHGGAASRPPVATERRYKPGCGSCPSRDTCGLDRTVPPVDAAQRVLRDALCEMDWRFGSLGDDSIFAALDAQGVLHHRVDGIDDASITAAMSEPPATGRAKARGEFIRQAIARNERQRYEIGWQQIDDFNEDGKVALDLSDPLMVTR
jgi:proteasome accessory factor A